ncbi:ectopic P granules protein 5 homolog [Anopheles cruzii]|uniref:ectopic P granules protein 5 homolog n=1 Tax=Anopheles cruzii TaxID=68878 RepID=UPI0022EC62AA|nr:ectopic P granules protein 5 homolog [Anopheles cruzii]
MATMEMKEKKQHSKRSKKKYDKVIDESAPPPVAAHCDFEEPTTIDKEDNDKEDTSVPDEVIDPIEEESKAPQQAVVEDQMEHQNEPQINEYAEKEATPTAPPLSFSGGDAIEVARIYPTIPVAISTLRPPQSHQLAPIDARHIYPVLPNIERSSQQPFVAPEGTKIYPTLPDGTMSELSREQLSKIFSSNDTNELLALKTHFETCEAPAAVRRTAKYTGHPLYALLTDYMQKCIREVQDRETLRVCRKKLERLQGKVWRETSTRFSGTATCADGKIVTASTVEKVAELDQSVLEGQNRVSREIEERMYDLNKAQLAAAARAAEIEDYICVQLAGYDAKICKKPYDAVQSGLRDIFTILLYFLRVNREKPGHRQPPGTRSKDERRKEQNFSDSVRGWMRECAVVLVWLGNVHDRLNVLLQLLHCEAGTPSWGKELISPLRPVASHGQKASSKWLADGELGQVLKMLELGLASHPQRESFLKASASEDVDELLKSLDSMTVTAKAVTPCEDDSDNQQVDWLVVDSDGEDCTGSGEVAPLKEDDMIAFLDQMPFADVFETLTAIGSAEASCVTITLHHMLRAITVALEIVRVLAIGVRTYGNQQRYDSFIRRLGRLIAHTVHYVADLFSLYPGRSNPIDPACQEFQRLLRRAVCSLACLRENAAWQYVLSLPYRLLAFTDTWWLYSGVLADVEGWNERTLLSELVPNDGERHIQMDKVYRRLLERSPKDVFYVCQLIVSLVDARDIKSETGIYFVAVKDFFQILLRIDHEDQPVLLEYELNQLMFLLNKHPLLCEAMVDELQWCVEQDTFGNDFPGVRDLRKLFRQLPFSNYSPTAACIDKLSRILRSSGPASSYSFIALEILQSFQYTTVVNGQLWIPLSVQLYILNTVIAAHRQHIPLDPNATPAATANKPFFEAYDKLCWAIVGKLKVHRLDQPQECMVRVIHEPEVALGDVPGLEQVPEIREGVEERRPLAIYAALLATTVGHWVPVFCHTGVKLLADHLCDHSRKLAIRCLQLIVPLFLDCPQSLRENESFLTLLSKVIGKPPKEARWWSTSGDGEEALIEEDATLRVYCLASRMVYLQLSDHKMYGLSTPAPLVEVWVQVLTALPEWKKCPKVLRMLDVVADVAHHYEPAWDSLRKHLLPHYLDLVEVKSPTASKNRLFMRNSDEESLYSLKPDLLALSMVSFELEAERTELELWPGLLQTLAADPAVSIDEALKRVIVEPATDYALSGGKLVLYKVARQIISFDHKHPLQVYLWLRFFRIFYTMIPAADGDLPVVHGSTDRLLAYDKQLEDKLKAAAQEQRDYYAKLVPTPVLPRSCDSEHAKAAQAQLYQFLAGFYESCLLWLQSDMLNGISLGTLRTLPEKFNKPMLQIIFNKSTNYLIEFNDGRSEMHRFDRIRVSWDTLLGRHLSRVNQQASATEPASTETRDPAAILESIAKRLSEYDLPVPLTALRCKLPSVPVYELSVDTDPRRVVSGIETSIGVLIKFATKQYRPAWDNLRSLQQQYRELLPKRFSVEKQVKRKLTECSMLTKRCTGPVTVSIVVSKTIERKEIGEKITQNRSKFDEALKAAIHTPDPVLLALHQANVLLMQLDRWFSDSGALGVHLLPKDHSVRALIGRFVPVMIEHSNLRCPATEQVLKTSFSLFMARVPSLVYDPLLASLHTALIRSDVTILDFLPHVKAAQIPGSHMLQLYSRLLKLNYGRQLEKRAFITVFDEQFDLLQWLKQKSMSGNDLDGMIVETVKALCSTADSSPTTPCKDVPDLSKQFHDTLQRHLLTLVDDNFPQHYETILMELLNGCEQRQLSPEILLAVNNAVRAQWRVPPITNAINSSSEVRALLSRFTGRQYEGSDRFNIYQMVTSAIRRLSQYFVTQRTQNCLHGLYPQYRAYVMPLALTFATLGQAYIETFIPSQISSMREAESHVNTVWDTLSKLFSAWLEPYEKTNFASWIQQVGPNSPQELLLQWSDLYVAEASQMLVAFTHCVESLITKLDDSVRIQERYDGASSVLALVFDWYERNYAHRSVADTVLTPANVQLVTLPWEKFHPGELTLGNFNRILDRFTPIAHQFAAQVFIRCRWERLTDDLRVGDLLGVCVKLAHEPTVQVNGRSAMMGTLEALSKMRWVGFDPSELKVTLDWFVMSTNASIILRLASSPSPITSLDEAILNLLLVASGLRFNEQNPTTEQGNDQQMRKREMFMRCAVRLLLTYVKRNKKALVANPNGSDQFSMAVKGLVELVAHATVNIRHDPGENSDGRKTVTLLTQLFEEIRVCASEPTFGYFTQAVRNVLEQDSPGCGRLVESVLLGCALYSNRAPIEIMLTIEVALFKHFRLSYQPCDYCSTSLAGSQCGGHRDCRSQFGQWLPVLQLIDPTSGWLKSLQETERISAVPLLLHGVVMSRFVTAPNDAERLQTLAQLQTQLGRMNVSTQYESRLYLLWGLMAYGVMTLLATTPDAVTLLQEFVQYLSSVIRGPFGTVNRLVQSALSLYKGTSASPTRRTVAQFLIVCLDFCRQGYYPTGRSASESQHDAVGDDFDMLSDEASDRIGEDKSPKVRAVTFLGTKIMEVLNDASGVPPNQKDPTKAAWGKYLESIRSQEESSTAFAQVVEQSMAPLCVEILSILGGQDTDILMHTALDGWKKRGL